MIPLKDRAKGKWRGILAAIGVEARYLTGKHGPCPFCEGRDRWRFDDKDQRGTWICSHCGAGDGVELVKRLKGCEFKDAAQLIEREIGGALVEEAVARRTDAELKAAMRKAWKGSVPAAEAPHVVAWWKGRGLSVPPSSALRANSRAMLAKVTDAAGEGCNVHRTYLKPDGSRADMENHRLLMEGELPPGSAVRLLPPTDVIGIAEGIETAWAATCLTGIPCWAALTAGNMERWSPPEGVGVIVFGDADASYTGQAAAYALARRLKVKQVEVDVRLPDDLGTDWNDVARKRLSA